MEGSVLGEESPGVAMGQPASVRDLRSGDMPGDGVFR